MNIFATRSSKTESLKIVYGGCSSAGYPEVSGRRCGMILRYSSLIKYTVDVAQLVRASDCDSEGRGFEPHLPPKKSGSRQQQ